MAKSMTSALIGIAIDEGLIASVNDPTIKYISELKQKDPRFNYITIKNLLAMSSGLRYVEQSLPWSDDTKHIMTRSSLIGFISQDERST
jgi:CubicO group peptidase (beta-lactamase class C family)